MIKPNNEDGDSRSVHGKSWLGFWKDLAMKECAGCQLAPAVTSGSPHCLRIGICLEVECYKELKFRQRPYHTVRAPTSAKTSYFDSSVFFGKRKNLKISLGFRRFKKEASIMKRRNDNYPPYLKQWGT